MYEGHICRVLVKRATDGDIMCHDHVVTDILEQLVTDDTKYRVDYQLDKNSSYDDGFSVEVTNYQAVQLLELQEAWIHEDGKIENVTVVLL